MSEITPIRREVASPLENGADILLNASNLPQIEKIREATRLAQEAATPREVVLAPTAAEIPGLAALRVTYMREEELGLAA